MAELWTAYGPSKVPITFDHESFVGPTDANDRPGPLAVVSGADDSESLVWAKKIAALLNQFDKPLRGSEIERPDDGR
jgi:hypothetical protein